MKKDLDSLVKKGKLAENTLKQSQKELEDFQVNDLIKPSFLIYFYLIWLNILIERETEKNQRLRHSSHLEIESTSIFGKWSFTMRFITVISI